MGNGMIVTHQDRLDADDARRLGISLIEYKEARCIIASSNNGSISKEEILRMCRNMHTANRISRS